MKKIRSILVGTDLSDASDMVVRSAGEIGLATGAAVHALHAFDLPSGTGVRTSDSPAATFPRRIEAAERALDDQLERALPSGVQVGSRRVEIYVAHKAILDGARAVDADLVVVGAHGRRRFGDEWLGSTADRVIRSAEMPCLIARAPLSLPLRRIVAPVDRSPAALAALEVAIHWGLALGERGGATEVHVAHVLPEALNVPDFGLEPEKIARELREEVQEARSRVAGAEELSVREEVRWADTAVDEIVRLLGNPPADLVVVGTHGRGPVKRFLVGSVASGVSRRSPCPVLLVPPAMWEEEG
jgi:nucleotide-binding universal stress UspA family protein